MTNIENPKNPKKFECIHCNYMTSSKKYYEKHLLTRKDKIRTMTKEKS
jgi:transcription elongation factor Elf1